MKWGDAMEDVVDPDPQRSDDGTTAPTQVTDGALACVRFVEKKIGIALDFEVESLPLLDHYLRDARTGSPAQETIDLLASVAGCYFGEVVRARYPMTWHAHDDEPLFWSLSTPSISIFPVAIARVTIENVQAERRFEVFRFARSLRAAVGRRLDGLPRVSDDEYTALSTRVEVIEIAFDVLAAATRTSDVHDHACCSCCAEQEEEERMVEREP